ncbi:hypothetical protein BH09VER1_BH09VER1_15360 [soil metagenome]
MSAPATAQPTLTEPRERVYFAVVLILSVLIWATLVICGLGLVILASALFLWLANGLLLARARSESIEVTCEQFPAIHQALQESCSALGLPEIPRLYLLPFAGTLNLFTIRHACRPFTVLPASLLNSKQPDPAEIRFLIGHELGRLRTHHPLKLLLVLPGRFFPLLGSAYSRARIFTSDRHGAAAAEDPEASARALLFQFSQPIDLAAVTVQASANLGFFGSWHELMSGQPSLISRISAVLSPSSPAPRKLHPLACVTGLFTLSGFGSGFSSFMFSAVVAVLLFGVILPIRMARREKVEAREAHIEHQERLLSAKEIILTEGTIDPRLSGIWTGGSPADSATSDYLRWTTGRKMDGNLDTAYEQRANGVIRKWAKHGQWRLYKDKYQELYDSEKPKEYTILRVEPDSVRLTEDPSKANASITEVRQPGAP